MNKPAQIERAKRLAPPSASPKAALYAALARARGEFGDIPKTRIAKIKMKEGGSYSYKYADLADVFRAIDPALSAYGLCVWQEVDGMHLVTTVMHSDGGEKETRWPIKPMPKRGLEDCQSFQSAVQVAKRYSLTAALGISTEETVEGDPRLANRDAAMSRDQSPDARDFETDDGVRFPVGGKYDPEKSDRDNAKEAARAIIEQFKEVKTIRGMPGAYDRNERFIDRIKVNHPDLFDDIIGAYDAMCGEREEA